MAAHTPADMLPRMDWNTEDKQTAWAFFRERLEQYFVIAMTLRQQRSLTSCSMVAKRHLRDQVKDQVDQTKLKDQMANDSFQKIKDLIAKTASQPLRYYDRTKPVVVQANASQGGLSACLL